MSHRRRHDLAWVSAAVSGVLCTLPCAAGPLTAARLQSRLQSEATACPAGAPKLKIERLTIVGAGQYNRIRRDMGAKPDGQAGQRYAAIYVRNGRRVVPVDSLGPLDASVKPDDLRALRRIGYCGVDED